MMAWRIEVFGTYQVRPNEVYIYMYLVWSAISKNFLCLLQLIYQIRDVHPLHSRPACLQLRGKPARQFASRPAGLLGQVLVLTTSKHETHGGATKPRPHHPITAEICGNPLAWWDNACFDANFATSVRLALRDSWVQPSNKGGAHHC